MRVTEQWRVEIEKGNLPSSVHKTYIPEKVEASDGDVRKAAFVVSTGDEDRDGDTVNPKGWMLDNYRKNPVVLWAHDTKALPIARAESIGVVDGRLKSVTVFPKQGTYPFADQVFGLVRDGFLSGTSVGFHPIEAAPRKTKGIAFEKQELYEFSILPIPSNREALREAKAAGHDVSMVVKWAEDFLDYAEANGIWVPKYQIQKALKAVLPIQVSVPAVPSSRAGAGSEGHATAGAELSDEEAKGFLDIVTKDEEPEVEKRIRKDGDQWCVYTEDYSKKLGCHDTREGALAQLRAVEANKDKAASAAHTVEAEMDVIKGIADAMFGDQTKELPPWLKEKPKTDEEGKVDPKEAADAAKAEAEAQNDVVDQKAEAADAGETPATPAQPAPAEGGPDALFAGLQSEIEPLKMGGDPTQIATALKAALEKFAAAFMQQYAGAGGQAPPPPPPPNAPPAPPPPPPMKSFKLGEGFSLTEEELRETIQKAVRRNVDEARMHLTGRLPG